MKALKLSKFIGFFVLRFFLCKTLLREFSKKTALCLLILQKVYPVTLPFKLAWPHSCVSFFFSSPIFQNVWGAQSTIMRDFHLNLNGNLGVSPVAGWPLVSSQMAASVCHLCAKGLISASLLGHISAFGFVSQLSTLWLERFTVLAKY